MNTNIGRVESGVEEVGGGSRAAWPQDEMNQPGQFGRGRGVTQGLGRHENRTSNRAPRDTGVNYDEQRMNIGAQYSVGIFGNFWR